MKPLQSRPALIRSVPFWILLVASVGLAAGGAVLIAQHLGTMTKTLGDGSATGLEVYGGQSWIVVGATLLGTGVLGVLLALALAAATALVAAATPVVAAETAAEPFTDFSDSAETVDAPAPEVADVEDAVTEEASAEEAEAEAEEIEPVGTR
ncbi:hypothetical protein [Microbacterium panaciterrae]|uniref:Dinucleotide-utilizing enzyme n=1 Tax=Microbacterium panaciterrae TaxID=985759 RepID=A0ABP8P4L5_9MICO